MTAYHIISILYVRNLSAIISSGLRLAYAIFMLTDTLSAGLQKQQLNCGDGSAMANSVTAKLQEMRSGFEEFYQRASETGAALGNDLAHYNVVSELGNTGTCVLIIQYISHIYICLGL